jgi:hypothetical protein
MPNPPPPLPFDNVYGTDFEHMDSAFAACQCAEARTKLAQIECSQILKESSKTELRAYFLLGLIGKHCGDVTTVLPRSDLQELRKLSRKAQDNRIVPLGKILKAWGERVVSRLGLATESYNLLRYASKACKIEPDWNKARTKLNQIISVKGPWRDPSSNESEPIKLETQHYELLSAWKEADLVWHSQPPLHLPFRELPDGLSYDPDGFVILSEQIAPQNLTVAAFRNTPLSPRPGSHIEHNGAQSSIITSDTNPANSDQPTAVGSLNAYMEEVEDESEEHDQLDSTDRTAPIRASCNPVSEHGGRVSSATESQRKRQLRPRGKDTASSPGKRARIDDKQRESERNGSERRDQARPKSKRRPDQMALHGNGKTRKHKDSNDDSGKRDKSKDQVSRAMLQAEKTPFEHSRVHNHLLADDCATDVLLKDICPARNYTPDFEPTPVQISLRSLQVDQNDLAKLSEYVIGVRENYQLDSPQSGYLCKQLALYHEALSPKCPFDLATTIQYSEQEQWGIVARERIPKGPVPYLRGANVDVTNVTGALEECLQFGRMDGPCGTPYVVVGSPRFLNHRCIPNARLEVHGAYTVVIALDAIEKGTEITIYYGKDYFGRGNAACSCLTCKPPSSSNHQPRFWPQRELLRAQPLAKERGQAITSFGSMRSGPCQRFYRSAISRLTSSRSEHVNGDSFDWLSDPLFIEPTDQAVEVFENAPDVLLVVTTADQFRRLIDANKVATYFLLVDLDHDAEQERAELAAFMKELELLSLDASFTVQHPENNFSVSAKQVWERFQRSFFGQKPPNFVGLSKSRNELPWNLLDVDLRSILGPRNFPINGIHRFDALSRAVRSIDSARHRSVGKRVGQSKNYDLADAAGCLGFAIAGEQGTESSEHLDLWPNTLVQASCGGKGWCVNTEVLSSAQEDHFAAYGTIDCDMKMVPLVAGSGFVMIGGTKVLPIHRVIGLQHFLGTGLMFMDAETPRDLKGIRYRWTHPLTINEHLPRDGPRLLKELGRINRCWSQNLEGVEPDIKEVLSCTCTGKCTNCVCMESTVQRLAGCTAYCACDCKGTSLDGA